MEIRNVLWKKNDGTYYFGDGNDSSTDYRQATSQEIVEIESINTVKEQVRIKWKTVYAQWDVLTVTTILGHTFAANKEAMRLISFKANNMGDTAVILWEEDWGQFNTNIVELKEALNLAADAHQAIINSVFGV